jgi:tetratricopeptide (TPR) repeat protein
VLLVAAPVALYWNSLHAPFVLDDRPVVLENASIRSLWPVTGPLSPPAGGLPVSARPVANLSLAVSHAISGEGVTGYHAVNLALHVLAGLALWGVLRRTLAQPVVPEKFRAQAEWLALAIAALWAVHPLQTAAVTYVSQRTELLATLFYLLTLYAFNRCAAQAEPDLQPSPGLWPAGRGGLGETRDADQPARRSGSTLWGVVAVVACLLGMGSKETMVSAPLLVLLYDRTFFAGTFAEAWRRRGSLHGALMATWALLLWLVWHSASRGGTAGWDVAMSPAAYALTQGEAIMGYLARSVYPYPLVFDYGDYLTPRSFGAILDVALVAGLVASTLVACLGSGFLVFGSRTEPQIPNPKSQTPNRVLLGFLGAVFFAVLAPTSSIVPVATQTIADHRMYLPLAVVLTVLGLAVFAWLGRRAWIAGLVALFVFGGLTVVRNRDYATAVELWRDTVRKRPDNLRARNNLAASLLEAGQVEAGLAELRAALAIKPDHPDVLRNLAQAELDAGKLAEALKHAELAQQLDPRPAAGWVLLGAARLRAGQAAPAVEAYTRARQLRPDSTAAEYGLAVALFQAERTTEALAAFEALRQREPEFPGLHLNYGGALLDSGKAEAALREFDAALAHEPPTAELLHLRSLALLQLGRKAEAVAAVQATLKLTPDYAPALELARQLGLTTNGH